MTARMRRGAAMAALAFLTLVLPFARGEEMRSTNVWVLETEDYLEHVSFIIADGIEARGRTFDDAFWITSGPAELEGRFGNDVWLIASQARLGGIFADHARVIAQHVQVTGTVSNGLWSAAGSITAATNSVLHGQQFLYADSITLLGHIEGDVYARAGRMTIGGTVVGSLRIHADEIIVRPGTTVVGDFIYVTTNQTIVLDANSNVSGSLTRIETVPASSIISPQWSAMLQLYWFGAALLIGIPFMLIFPGFTGQTVRILRAGLLKCGLIGLAFMFGIPFLIIIAAISMIGLPLAAVLGAAYGLILYLAKFAVALAVGTALLGRRGPLSVSGALVCLVAGLFLYYSMALFPFVGPSLQTVAVAFGTGSLLLSLGAGRGRVRDNTDVQAVNPESN